MFEDVEFYNVLLTPLAKIMYDRGLSREDLYCMITEKTDVTVARVTISNLRNIPNCDCYVYKTLVPIALTLGITPNDLIVNPNSENGKW